MSKPSEVKAFYNSFIDKRMIDYRLYGNHRISEAGKFIRRYVERNSNILDIGCGIGIVTEMVSKRNRNGRTWACDISDRNISYAKKTVQNKRINFFVADIVNDFEQIQGTIEAPIDLVMMVDVIEHLPPGNLEKLFESFAAIVRQGGLIILAYPSPEYQNYLRANQPDELQVIDENIYISDLEKNAMTSGFHLIFFSYQNLGRKNQYVYCIFSKGIRYTNAYGVSSMTELGFLVKKFGGRLILPILKYKYLHRPFRDSSE
jgi:trans-aconitate 2-methyltransferase